MTKIVKCIDPDGIILQLDKEYEVIEELPPIKQYMPNGTYKLKDTSDYWNANRFEVVKQNIPTSSEKVESSAVVEPASMKKKIKCIDARFSAGLLEEGKIYEAEAENRNYYWINCYAWLAYRFVEVKDDTSTSAEKVKVPTVVKPASTKVEEEPFDFDTYNRIKR